MKYLPKELTIGFSNDTVRSPKNKLSFITFIDHEGKLRKEKSWYDWISKDIDPIKIENKSTSGFELLDFEEHSNRYGSRTMARLLHPKGFVFEITTDNFEELLHSKGIDNNKFNDECIFTWDGTVMYLTIVGTERHKQAIKDTKVQSKPFNKKDVKVGDVLVFKTSNDLLYLGSFYRVKSNGYFYNTGYYNSKYITTFCDISTSKYHYLYDQKYDRLYFKKSIGNPIGISGNVKLDNPEKYLKRIIRQSSEKEKNLTNVELVSSEKINLKDQLVFEEISDLNDLEKYKHNNIWVGDKIFLIREHKINKEKEFLCYDFNYTAHHYKFTDLTINNSSVKLDKKDSIDNSYSSELKNVNPKYTYKALFIKYDGEKYLITHSRHNR